MQDNQKLIDALNEAHNAIERAINTLRNQASKNEQTKREELIEEYMERAREFNFHHECMIEADRRLASK